MKLGSGRDGSRRRWRWLVAVGVVVLALASVAAWELRPRFPKTDARACADSVVPLEQQARLIGLALPDHVRDVRYDSARIDPDVVPVAEGPRLVLRLEFRAGPADIQRWLSANRLPKPVLWNAPGAQSASGSTCGDLEDGFSDWTATDACLAATPWVPYETLLVVNIDPNSRPQPAVLANVEQVATCPG
jgi:hypothetical protein